MKINKSDAKISSCYPVLSIEKGFKKRNGIFGFTLSKN